MTTHHYKKQVFFKTKISEKSLQKCGFTSNAEFYRGIQNIPQWNIFSSLIYFLQKPKVDSDPEFSSLQCRNGAAEFGKFS